MYILNYSALNFNQVHYLDCPSLYFTELQCTKVNPTAPGLFAIPNWHLTKLGGKAFTVKAGLKLNKYLEFLLILFIVTVQNSAFIVLPTVCSVLLSE